MKYRYFTSGTCSRAIEIEIEDNKIKDVEFIGGCPGNLLGIRKLTAGMTTEEIIKKFSGLKCGDKSTSCPDQLATALREISAKNAKQS